MKWVEEREYRAVLCGYILLSLFPGGKVMARGNVYRMTIRDGIHRERGEVLATELEIGDFNQNLVVTGVETDPDGITRTIWRDTGDRRDIAVITFYPGTGIEVSRR